jgi:hypothetical protein
MLSEKGLHKCSYLEQLISGWLLVQPFRLGRSLDELGTLWHDSFFFALVKFPIEMAFVAYIYVVENWPKSLSKN